MTILETLIFTLAVELYAGLISWKFYQKAGHPAWAAFVPIYNTYLLTRIIKRPAWWVILFYIPIVGNIMGIVAVFELLHVFNYRKLKYTIYTILTAGLYLAYLNYTEKPEYVGRDDKNIRTHVSELASSLIFAIVAATIIRTFTFEAFTIPTPSMEKSLMVGDFLFVSKLQYGSRLPITPLCLPLVHNRIPGTDQPSYLDWVQLPYMRLPKISDVQRLDPVVFNYPMETEKPVDKREHYVKRCIATPGDTLQIINGQVYINGDKQEMPDRALPQYTYYAEFKGNGYSQKLLKEQFDIDPDAYYLINEEGLRMQDYRTNKAFNAVAYIITIPTHKLEEFKTLPNLVRVIRLNSYQEIRDFPSDSPPALVHHLTRYEGFMAGPGIFPNAAHGDSLDFKWTRDNYGPLYIPKKGDKVELSHKNFLKFNRIIEVYEGNTLEVRNGKYWINGQEASDYTFQQDYYWMMGDNRHNSLDSRYWGYVPADHIVGKPVFIWMSWDKFASDFGDRLRTKRIFTTVSGEGERVSYFWPFVIIVALIYGFNYFRKRRKADKAA
ncbi:MAG: S26 family signal peptidase [Owenweeksia sp.]|nr:S26 family signal peptidase [Owenweeksia sp.]|tara:strand:+ start:6093 stop:7745 length:1653 start_codon:yes stop_codon:yes gene_type:complete